MYYVLSTLEDVLWISRKERFTTLSLDVRIASLLQIEKGMIKKNFSHVDII